MVDGLRTTYSDGMRRHPALIPLSHDHHHALAQALRLRRADDVTAGAVRDAFLTYAAADLEPHFQVEERALERIASMVESPAIVRAQERMLADHATLRGCIEQLRANDDGAPSAVDLVALGEALATHVRFEERELFELLQRVLGDDLGAAL